MKRVVDALLGIDFGTSNVKAAVYEPSGRVVSLALAGTPVVNEGPGRAVYPADRVWQTVAGVVRDAVSQLKQTTRIAAVATTSVGESVFPIDRDGEALAPALAWYDDRTQALTADWSSPEMAGPVFRISGVQVDGIYSAFKVLWFKREHSDLYARTRHWMPVGDYLNFRLCGNVAVCSSLASRTLLLDLSRREWSRDLMETFGLDQGQWPEVVTAGTRLGGVTRAAADATGLAPGTPVVAGGHDHICGALAAGAHVAGVVLDSMGTTEAIFTTLEAPPLGEEARRLGYSLGCHVAPDRYYAINGIVGAGGLHAWLRRTFWAGIEARRGCLRRAGPRAAASGEGARGLVVLPYFAGPGLAHPEPEIRGAILGLTLQHRAGDVARAVLEALTCEVRIMLQDLERLANSSITSLRLIGGASRNALWRRLKADITGCAVSLPELVEAGCLGSAMLAGLGVGLYRDADDAVRQVYRESEAEAPDAAAHARYEPIFARFLRLRGEAGRLGRRVQFESEE
ncbi:carbohydrate kinase [bacterium]|nr:carbohydrate kinase [bacterium]